MAIPTIVGTGAANSGTGAVTYALPTHAANDILMLFVECSESAGVTAPSGGWAHISGSPRAQGSGVTALNILWLRAAGAGTTAPNVADPGNHQVGFTVVFRGVTGTGDPWDFSPVGTGAGGATSFAVVGGTTTVDDCLAVIAVCDSVDTLTDQFTSITNGSLSSFTQREQVFTDLGNGGGIAVYTGGKATAGATGTTNGTIATSGSYSALSFALKPASDPFDATFETAGSEAGFSPVAFGWDLATLSRSTDFAHGGTNALKVVFPTNVNDIAGALHFYAGLTVDHIYRVRMWGRAQSTNPDWEPVAYFRALGDPVTTKGAWVEAVLDFLADGTSHAVGIAASGYTSGKAVYLDDISATLTDVTTTPNLTFESAGVDGWQARHALNDVDMGAISLLGTGAHSGTKALRLTMPTSVLGEAGVKYIFGDLDIGVTYRLTLWGRSQAGTGPDFRADVYYTAGGPTVTTKGSWVQTDVVFTATATVHDVGIRTVGAFTAGTTLDLDDVSVTPVATFSASGTIAVTSGQSGNPTRIAAPFVGTIVFDSVSNALRTDTSDPYAFNHTGRANGSGGIQGVVLFAINQTDNSSSITGVTYGGVAMTFNRIATGTANEIKAYTLVGASLSGLGGTQSVSVDFSGAVADDYLFVCMTFTSDSTIDPSVVNTSEVIVEDDGADPQGTLGTPGAYNYLGVMAWASGLDTQPTPLSGWTQMVVSGGAGKTYWAGIQAGDADSDDIVAGYTGTSDTVALLAFNMRVPQGVVPQTASGTIAAVSGQSGAVTKKSPVSGSIVASTGQSGNPTRVLRVLAATGTIPVVSNLVGNAVRKAPVSGTIPIVSGQAGDAARIAFSLAASGTITLATTLVGDPTRILVLLSAGGTIQVVSDLDGNPIHQGPATGTIAIISTLVGSPVITGIPDEASGTIAIVSGLIGDPYIGSPGSLLLRLVLAVARDDHQRPPKGNALWYDFHYPPTQLALLLYMDGTVIPTWTLHRPEYVTCDAVAAGGHDSIYRADSWEVAVLTAAGYTLEAVT